MAGSEPLSQTLKGTVDDQNISFLDAVRSAGYTKYRVDLSSMFVKKGTYFTFLKLCIEQGPILEKKPDSIWVMGDKATARETMKKFDVSTVPGSDGLLQTMKEAIKLAHEIGFPVMKFTTILTSYHKDPYAKEFGIKIGEKLASVEARILPTLGTLPSFNRPRT